jgi:hypothetical protein
VDVIKAIIGYATINPPVIPVITCKPPLSPANTGNPNAPRSIYARVAKNAYLGLRSIPVRKIAKNDRLKGMGCRGIVICDITDIIAVNIPVRIKFLVFC